MQILRLAVDYLEPKRVIIDNAVNVSYLFSFYFHQNRRGLYINKAA